MSQVSFSRKKTKMEGRAKGGYWHASLGQHLWKEEKGAGVGRGRRRIMVQADDQQLLSRHSPTSTAPSLMRLLPTKKHQLEV